MFHLALCVLACLVSFGWTSPVSLNTPGSTGFWGEKPQDCADVQRQSYRESGVYTIFVGRQSKPIQVYCDLDTSGGGWLVFQRREDGYGNFYRGWQNYADGFGDLYGEFWLGNHLLHLVTNQANYSLRVDLADLENNTRYAEYSHFSVGAPFEKYKLEVAGYTGDAGDSLSGHNGAKFSTHDQDNDIYSSNCARTYKGAWWYTKCHSSNLNGFYYGGAHTSYADGVNWRPWRGYHYSLKLSELKIRPITYVSDPGQ